MPTDRMDEYKRMRESLGGEASAGKVTSYLAQARLQLDRGNLDAARKYAQRALQLAPANQEAIELIERANRD